MLRREISPTGRFTKRPQRPCRRRRGGGGGGGGNAVGRIAPWQRGSNTSWTESSRPPSLPQGLQVDAADTTQRWPADYYSRRVLKKTCPKKENLSLVCMNVSLRSWSCSAPPPPPAKMKNKQCEHWVLIIWLSLRIKSVSLAATILLDNTETYSVFGQVRALSAQQNQDRLHPVLDNSNSLHWWNLTFPNLLMVCLLWCKGVFILIMKIIPMELLQKYYPMKLIKMNIHTTHF